MNAESLATILARHSPEAAIQYSMNARPFVEAVQRILPPEAFDDFGLVREDFYMPPDVRARLDLIEACLSDINAHWRRQLDAREMLDIDQVARFLGLCSKKVNELRREAWFPQADELRPLRWRRSKLVEHLAKHAPRGGVQQQPAHLATYQLGRAVGQMLGVRP